MQLTKNSPLQFTPDNWRIEFHTSEEDWTEQVIGWAVCISFTDYEGRDDPDTRDTEGDTETEIQPVLLEEEQYAVTLRDYLRDRDRTKIRWRLIRN